MFLELSMDTLAMYHTMRFVALMKQALTVLIGVCCTWVYAIAQGTSNLPPLGGQPAVPFMLIGPDSRANGMGDANTGMAEDLHAIHWNPSGLAFQYDRQISLAFSRWLPQFNADLYYARGAYGQYVPALQSTVAVDFLLFNLGQFIRTDIQGRELGRFNSFEFAISAAIATQITDDIGIGGAVKYIQSNLGATTDNVGGGVGQTAALDISAMWKPLKFKVADLDLGDRFSLGVNLKNMGPAITYNQFADPLPVQARIGMAATLVRDEFNELNAVFDYAKQLVQRDSTIEGGFVQAIPAVFTAWGTREFEIAGGVEYWYDKTVALRGGYYFEPPRVRDAIRNYFTVGVGVRFDIVQGDFSYIIPVQVNNPLANTLRFSLIVNFRDGKQLLGIKTNTQQR
ncbi:MAG: PorV/PorQ family protein [Candidatus Kapabacteria bacterium]|nr:PorV/PorQ family protein [Candidatus Kapabacteria bacterium]